MLDYIYCNIQVYILYVINENNTIHYVIYDNISLHSITQSFVFSMRCYITRAFCLLYLVHILFDDGILLVYYIAKYILFNYFRFRLPDGAINIMLISGLR